MQLQPFSHRVSTPRSRIPKWCSTLRNSYLVTINHQPIHSMDDLLLAISTACQNGIINASCQFATERSYGIHPHHSVPQLYFDQLNIIAQHLQDIKASQHSTHTDASIRQTQPTPHNTENTSRPEQIVSQSAH